MRHAYEEFIRSNKIETKLELTDEKLMSYMNENHQRWYELVEIYGNPIDSISLK